MVGGELVGLLLEPDFLVVDAADQVAAVVADLDDCRRFAEKVADPAAVEERRHQALLRLVAAPEEAGVDQPLGVEALAGGVHLALGLGLLDLEVVDQAARLILVGAVVDHRLAGLVEHVAQALRRALHQREVVRQLALLGLDLAELCEALLLQRLLLGIALHARRNLAAGAL